VVERYSTLEEDGDLPYGSGCGGVVYILLEHRRTASSLLRALKAAWDVREPLAIATVLEGPHIGERVFAGLHAEAEAALGMTETNATTDLRMQELAERALVHRAPADQRVQVNGAATRVWVDYRAARPGLWIFGAGDDARPLARLARELGWFVAVADGRSHLATAGRFATADRVLSLPIRQLPASTPDGLALLPTDAAALLTHSFEQDSRLLAYLLRDTGEFGQAYVGVLGPQRRTREALAEAARLLGFAPDSERVERWLAQVYAPMGIDLGADTPASIALSILAEIQQTLNAATALPLRQVRATRLPVTQD
jgi:xanthine/CO dehydrogenase XdhC/CoxF family maturation factor